MDARSDLFGLGSVLYERVAGYKPFTGETISHVIVAILEQEPPPLDHYSQEVPVELERIVKQALVKDREARYQTAREFLLDLKVLKQELEFEAKPGRTRATEADKNKSLRTISSTKIIVGEIKRHQFSEAITLATIVIATVAAFFYFSRKPVLTDKGTILLTEFVNTTGEPVFDGTLKQGLAVILGQSPFLDIFPESRVRETLQSMKHTPDDPVTEPMA